jgi:hypothetical protein
LVEQKDIVAAAVRDPDVVCSAEFAVHSLRKNPRIAAGSSDNVQGSIG